jgi:acyl transferase domain-containing protein
MDIAVVGVAGRYPRAPDIEAFWQNLLNGRDCVSEVPAGRWDWQRFADAAMPERYSYCRWGGFIDGIDLFDPAFFGILPRDAAVIDPHERLFLECAWGLLERAGYLGPSTIERETGVFVGLMHSTYGQIGASGWSSGRFLGARSAPWSVANRVSYYFDFHGPSFAVDAACSSSLLSIHLAAESLRRGECRMAVAGGVNLILHPAHYIALCSAGMLARDGRCKTFDERADGFVPGEGVGAVLLKPADRAIADGDRIWGLIKGGHVRSEGRTMGYAVPSPSAQADLIAGALERAGVDPATVGYVEAHGTGTALGDPIEVAGLSQAYRRPADGAAARFIGAVKTNIGHLEGAAGVAGFTKALLQLEHGWLVPSINLAELNQKIDFAAAGFGPVREAVEWPAGTGPRRAAVSSFGAGGTDVHLVLEEYRRGPQPAPRPAAAATAFLLSARNADQLARLAGNVLASLSGGAMRDAAHASVLYSSQVGRREMRQRLGIVAATREALIRGLECFVSGAPSPDVYSGRAAPAAAMAGKITPANDREAVARWCDGNVVAWDAGWKNQVPDRAAFPGYPFAQKSYWAEHDDGR